MKSRKAHLKKTSFKSHAETMLNFSSFPHYKDFEMDKPLLLTIEI